MRNKKEDVSWTLTHPLFISSYSFVIFHFFIFLHPMMIRLSFHELLGSSELVSHHAQEFLTLLENVEINQGNLHQAIILHILQAVDVFLAKHGKFILAGISLGENLTIVLISVGLNLFATHLHQVIDLLTY